MATQPATGATVGSECEVKKLYQHPRNMLYDSGSWSELEDPLQEAQRNNQVGQAHAIVHRFWNRNDDGIWTTHSINVNSPVLKAALDKIFHGYLGWTSTSSQYTFSSPYKPLIHRWEEFEECYKTETEQRTKIELLLFRKEVHPLISAALPKMKAALATGVVVFKDLWHILAPGRLFISVVDGNRSVSKLVHAELVVKKEAIYDEDDNSTKSYWKVTMAQYDWNGSDGGFATYSIKIYKPPRNEPVHIATTGILPLDSSPDKQKILDGLLVRGRKFESLRGFFVMHCRGKKYVKRRDPDTGRTVVVAEPIGGRVVVDAHAFYYCQNIAKPSLNQGPEAKESDSDCEYDSDLDSEYGSASERRHARGAKRVENLKPMTDEECVLATPRVRGFDLKTKDWCEFNVQELRAPAWNDSPYINLVLPSGTKELLIAFTENCQDRKAGFDDFVKNKGKGMIFLLCGPPGVGKTLSAEAVAEKIQAPLYSLSAGELGTDPRKLETALTDAFKCCQLWDAVLLLDEADVFLEARTSDSLQRNELVAIFLRHVEYYQGLLFLTTNRAQSIDRAFESRVDLVLPYSQLNREARRNVWANFINRMPKGEVELQESDIDELARLRMNGREIKSSIKTAAVLAAKDKPLRMRHFNIVLDNRRRVEMIGRNQDEYPAEEEIASD